MERCSNPTSLRGQDLTHEMSEQKLHPSPHPSAPHSRSQEPDGLCEWGDLANGVCSPAEGSPHLAATPCPAHKYSPSFARFLQIIQESECFMWHLYMFSMLPQFVPQSVRIGTSLGWLSPAGWQSPSLYLCPLGRELLAGLLRRRKADPAPPPSKPEGDGEWLPSVFQNPGGYSKWDGEIDFLLQWKVFHVSLFFLLSWE